MGFINGDESIQRVERVSSRNPLQQTNRNLHNQFKSVLRHHGKEQNCKHTKKSAAVFPEPETGYIEIEKDLDSINGLSDQRDCVWLSSGCKFPSFLRHDGSLDSWNLSLSVQFSSMLSLSANSCECLESGKEFCIFDGSRISPMEEASLVLDRTQEDSNEKELEEEEDIVIWLNNSVENEVKDYSVRCTESIDSSQERSLCSASVFLSSCTSHSACDEFVQDFDKADLCSLLDLEVEDSELTWEREQGCDVFESDDFPSPSYKASIRLPFGSSSSISSSKSSWQTEETNSCSEISDSDEPLFWPFDQSSYQHSAFKDFICISPRRDVKSTKFPALTRSKSDRWIYHQQRNHLASRKNDQGCTRRIIFNPTPVSDSMKGKVIRSGNAIQSKVAIPSRLSRSTKSFSDRHSSDTQLKEKLHTLKINTQKQHVDEISDEPSKGHGGDLLQHFVIEQIPIEKLVGLNEFDGHEGIELEFDEAQFAFLRSPCRNVNLSPLSDHEHFIISDDKK
ncbi:hypothetical protein J5N97_020961 [Dioscorea zingiberensis]|uniref:Uncharacterized protein n=1 Tax=Dioscorea zingiberensis TaxID=325984 RepID=A0A9D5CI48_9LILI|nr:hypothetical protein J5N97_020961 [Dioscorea zingiberensis]